MLRRLQRMRAAYGEALRDFPLAMNGVQGAVLGAAGDVLAQTIEHAPCTSASRAARAGAIGGFWSSTLVPAVYRLLDGAFPGTSARAVICKSFTDIAILGVFGNAASLTLRGTPIDEVAVAMPGVLVNECYIWLPYNLFAFRLVPSHIRPTTTALLTFGWNTYMSWTAHQSHARSDDDTDDARRSSAVRTSQDSVAAGASGCAETSRACEAEHVELDSRQVDGSENRRENR